MQETSALYNSIISGNHSFEVRAVAGNNTYTHEDMYSMTEYNTLFSALSIGNCISRKLELVLYNAAPANLQTIIPQIRVINDTSQSEWISKGIFFVDTIQSSPLTTNTIVTAYDAMLKAEVIYFKSGEWVSKSGIDVVTEIAEHMGIDIEEDTVDTITDAAINIDYVPVSGEKGTTEREMLSYIAMMCGGNFYINDQGELELVLLEAISTEDIDLGQNYTGLSISNLETVVGVRMRSSDDTYYYAPSNITIDQWEALTGDKIECTCPYANQEITNALYTRFEGLEYQPYSMNGAFVDPAAEMGDTILANDTYSLYLANQTLHFNQLGQSDLSEDATQSLNSLYPMASPVQKEVAKASAGITTKLSVMDGEIQAEVIRAGASEQSLDEQVQRALQEIQNEIIRATGREADIEGSIASAVQVSITDLGITESITNIQSILDAIVETQAYIRSGIIATSSGGTPIIGVEVGQTTTEGGQEVFNKFARFTSDGVYFYLANSNDPVAWMTGSKLYIKNAEITESIKLGGYMADVTNGIAFKWVGL